MKTIILDGKQVAQRWLSETAAGINAFYQQYHRTISLGVIQVGNLIASSIYIKHKVQQGQKIGVKVVVINLPNNLTTTEIVQVIKSKQEKFDGLLVQLPLPPHCDHKKVLNAIDPSRDVDGFSLIATGKIWQQKQFDPLKTTIACTPKGIIKLLQSYQIPITQKHVVIINRSNIIGKPLAAALLALNATVTICHSQTTNLKQHCQQADIIVSAVGKANFLDQTMVNPQAVVIDVGISYTDDNKITGDVVEKSLNGHCQAYSPVPKGVGPMTVAAIFANLLILAHNHEKSKIHENKNSQ